MAAVRRINKKFTNTSASAKLGKKGSTTTAVHDVGRRSGTPYVTPVWPNVSGRRPRVEPGSAVSSGM